MKTKDKELLENWEKDSIDKLWTFTVPVGNDIAERKIHWGTFSIELRSQIKDLLQAKERLVREEILDDLQEAYKMGMREFIHILCRKKMGAVIMDVDDKDIKDSKEFKELKQKYLN